MSLVELLERYGACGAATAWANTQADAATAWANCERADWMLWIGVRVNREACRPALYAIADLAVRTYAPRAMDAAADRDGGARAEPLREWAGLLRDLPEVVDEATARWANAWARSATATAAADAAYAAAAYAAADAAADAAARKAAPKEMADVVRANLPLSALLSRVAA